MFFLLSTLVHGRDVPYPPGIHPPSPAYCYMNVNHNPNTTRTSGPDLSELPIPVKAGIQPNQFIRIVHNNTQTQPQTDTSRPLRVISKMGRGGRGVNSPLNRKAYSLNDICPAEWLHKLCIGPKSSPNPCTILHHAASSCIIPNASTCSPGRDPNSSTLPIDHGRVGKWQVIGITTATKDPRPVF